MPGSSYPLPKPVRAIGVPYQGTHGKSFNQKGGSDNWESENAVDLPTPKGTPVYAVEDGTIGPKIGSLGSSGRFAGLRLHLVTNGNEFYYAHLSKLTVKAGQHVVAGQLIGYSGVANGVGHLHVASKNGDPRSFFGTKGGNDPSSASTDNSATPDLSGGGSGVPTVTPPPGQAPPNALGTPGADVELPGSVNYTLTPHHEAYGLWQQAASGTMVSPETMQMVSNAQLSAGLS